MPSLAVSAAVLAASLTLATVAVVPLVHGAPPVADGHWILQVEGDARGLAVVRITRKPDPCGRSVLEAPFRVIVRDAAGAELAAVPLDLSVFDLDPARAGTGLRVEGCQVTDTRVATLVNVPRFAAAAASVDIVRDGTVLGRLAGAEFAALVRAAEVR